ncbi:MAG: nucleotidyltransferase domain-containing protein [Desulfurococcales archaeon]|nr:nucleotidyltransferase domain-containing protein [Desulfurococcales archaeon]MCE4605161.1 nucleotidyltransferase domain-containing protein [Desulfurococcales archaeon]
MGRAASAIRSQEEMLRRAIRFARKAAERLSVKAVYVVGSRARGDYLDESDIDVVIVAHGVRKLNMKERLTLLADVAEPGVDYLVYDTEEWETGTTVWIRQLKKEAKRLSLNAMGEISGKDEE